MPVAPAAPGAAGRACAAGWTYINEINTLRKHFSAVKGGRLAMAAPEAAKVSLLLPDVPLRSLDALSSGPTSPDHSTVKDVRELIERYRLDAKFPPAVRAFFEREDLPESPGNKSWRENLLAKIPRPDALVLARRVTGAATMKDEDHAFRVLVFQGPALRATNPGGAIRN